MAKLTWLELQELVDKNVVDKNADVVVYDMSTGEELECDLIELAEENEWKPTIGINLKELDVE